MVLVFAFQDAYLYVNMLLKKAKLQTTAFKDARNGSKKHEIILIFRQTF